MNIPIRMALFLLVLLAACQSQDTLTIGYIGPLTGQYSQIGIDNLRSAQMAADEFDNARIVAEDSKFSPKEAVGAYRKLKEVDGAAAFIVVDTPSIEALKPLIEEDAMPTITIAQDQDPQKDFVFHIAESAWLAYSSLGEMMAQEDRPVFLIQRTTWAREVSDYYKRGFGEDATVLEFNADDNPSTILAKVESRGYKTISVDATPEGWIPLYRAMIESGVDERLVHILNYNDATNYLAGSFEGHIPNSFFEGKRAVTIKTWEDTAFRERYAERHGAPYTYHGNYGYDAVRLLVETNPLESGWIDRALQHEFSGVTGNISWSPEGDRIPVVVTGVIENKSLIEYVST